MNPLQPLVVCVVLNTDRRADTLECLSSIERSDYPNLHTIVLDCQSSDGSVEAVRSVFPRVHVIELSENRGYAGNNNVGIRVAPDTGARWVFVLNEDTVLGSTCVSKLVEAAAGDPRIGIVGPTVYHHDEPHLIQSAGGGLSRRWEGFHFGVNEHSEGQPTEARDVQWISGCGILVRREVIEAVGSLDERFFIYWEETEWCVRAAKAGWRIVHVPEAELWHKGVQRDYRPRPSVTYYSTRNRLLMLAIHEAPLSAWLVAWAQIARTLASWTLKPRWRCKRDHRDAMWHAVSDFLAQRWGRMPERAHR
jgi:GT2 family glycosyltransferase